MRFTPRLLPLPLLAAALLAGCARTSPAVGTWTGSAGPIMATLTLAPDGTGTLSLPPVMTGEAVSWTEQDGTVNLQIGGGAKTANGAGGPQSGVGTTITATLSEDEQAMTVPIRTFTLTLTKQSEGQ